MSIATLTGKRLWLRNDDVAVGSAVTEWPSADPLCAPVTFSGNTVVAAAQTPLGGKALSTSGMSSQLKHFWAWSSSSYDVNTWGAWRVFTGDFHWASAAAPSVGSPQWIRFRPSVLTVATSYTITSAGSDNPVDFTFRGSMDGTTWTTLDTRTAATLPGPFTFTNTNAYPIYELNITAAGSLARIARLDLNGANPCPMNTPGELFFVVKNPIVAGATESWVFGSNGDCFYPWADGNMYEGAFTSARPAITPTMSLNAWRLFRVSTTAAGVKTVYLDGVTQSTTTGNTLAWTRTPWLSRAGNLQFAEAVIFDRALDSTEVATVVDELTYKHLSAPPPPSVLRRGWGVALN